MMTRERKTGAPRLGVGPLHHIYFGAVVLQEIQVDGGESGERMTQIAHGGDSLQKDFRQQYRGAHVQVDAALMESDQQRTQQAEIAMRSTADGGRIRRRMGVRRIRADGYMY